MADYDNTNSGAMFFEEDKETERHPDYKGSINVEGQEYWLSAWDKVSKAGNNFISISIKKKEPRAEVTDTGKNSDSWQSARDRFKKDEPEESPINLDDIPF